jgi:O-antigen ligase
LKTGFSQRVYPARGFEVNWILGTCLAVALVTMVSAAGGTRPVLALPVCGLLGIAGLCLAVFWKGWSSGVRPCARCLWGVVLAGGYFFVRAMVSPVPALVLPDLLTLFGSLLVYFLAAGPAVSGGPRKVVFWALLALAGFEVFWGLRQFHIGDDWMPFGWIRTGMGRRAGGSFVSPNHFAGFLEVVGLMGISAGFWGRGSVLERGVAGYLGCLGVLGVIVSGSRGGYLSLAGGLLFLAGGSLWVVRRLKPERFRRVLAVTISIFALGGPGLVFLMRQSTVIRHRLDLLAEQVEKDKMDVRIGNWAAALDQARISPVFGTGAGTHLFYGRYFRRLPMQQDPVHAHGDYLEVLAEYGAVGVLLMVTVLVLHGRAVASSLHGAVNLPPEKGGGFRSGTLGQALGGGAVLITMAVHSVVDFNLHIPGNALVWSALLAWTGRGNVQVACWENAHRLVRGVAGIAGCVLLVLTARHFPEEWFGEKARVALRNGSFGQAREYGMRAVESGGRNPEIHFLLGEVFRVSGLQSPVPNEKVRLLERSLECFQRSLDLFAQNENAWLRRGQAFDGLGRYEEAGVAYREALKLDPKLGVLYLNYSRHLKALGRDAESSRIRELGERLRSGDRSLEGFKGLE